MKWLNFIINYSCIYFNYNKFKKLKHKYTTDTEMVHVVKQLSKFHATLTKFLYNIQRTRRLKQTFVVKIRSIYFYTENLFNFQIVKKILYVQIAHVKYKNAAYRIEVITDKKLKFLYSTYNLF